METGNKNKGKNICMRRKNNKRKCKWNKEFFLMFLNQSSDWKTWRLKAMATISGQLFGPFPKRIRFDWIIEPLNLFAVYPCNYGRNFELIRYYANAKIISISLNVISVDIGATWCGFHTTRILLEHSALNTSTNLELMLLLTLNRYFKRLRDPVVLLCCNSFATGSSWCTLDAYNILFKCSANATFKKVSISIVGFDTNFDRTRY